MHLVIDGYGGDPQALQDEKLIYDFLDKYCIFLLTFLRMLYSRNRCPNFFHFLQTQKPVLLWTR